MDWLDSDGPLGSRASLMMDLVVLAMVLVVPVLCWSIWLVRRGHYRLHKRLQLALGTALAGAVLLFEIHVQLHDWQARATRGSGELPLETKIALGIHLCFAIPVTLLWIWVIAGALRNIPNPPAPNDYTRRHKWLGRIAAVEMILTAFTGWTFYYFAFVR